MKNTVTSDIRIPEGQTSFRPGQIIRGSLSWLCEKPPKKAQLSLLWYTEGKGTEDVGVVDMMDIENPLASENRSFEFRLPVGPYSFSGRLISLIWALELQVDKDVRRSEFVLSPSGNEVDLRRRTGV